MPVKLVNRCISLRDVLFKSLFSSENSFANGTVFFLLFLTHVFVGAHIYIYIYIYMSLLYIMVFGQNKTSNKKKYPQRERDYRYVVKFSFNPRRTIQ